MRSREVIYNEFQSAEKGRILNGIVQRYERDCLVIDLGKTEAISPRRNRFPRAVTARATGPGLHQGCHQTSLGAGDSSLPGRLEVIPQALRTGGPRSMRAWSPSSRGAGSPASGQDCRAPQESGRRSRGRVRRYEGIARAKQSVQNFRRRADRHQSPGTKTSHGSVMPMAFSRPRYPGVLVTIRQEHGGDLPEDAAASRYQGTGQT